MCKRHPNEVSEAAHGYVRACFIPAVANSPGTPQGLLRWALANLTDTAVLEPEPQFNHDIAGSRPAASHLRPTAGLRPWRSVASVRSVYGVESNHR